MARQYRVDLDDLPEVQIPDWDLLARIEELISPYETDDPDFEERIYSADDSRGTYDAGTVEELREEAAKQEEPPRGIAIHLGSPHHSINLRMPKDLNPRAILISDDEAVVNHIATRLRELFAMAAIPKATTQIEGASFPVPVSHEEEWRKVWPEPEPEQHRLGTAETEFQPQATQSPQPSFWSQHILTLIMTVVGGVIVGLILALILGTS